MAGELVVMDGQMQWGDLLFGEGSPLVGVSLTGWDDLPDFDSASVLKPDAHGGWAGRMLAGQRTVEFSCFLNPDTEAEFPQLLRDLRRSTAVAQSEAPLVAQLAGQKLMVRGRVTRRALPASLSYLSGYPECTIQWECSDPLRYEIDPQSAWTPLPAGEEGLDWGTSPVGLDYPLSYGTPGDTGNVAAFNAGDAATAPLIEIRGPVQRPSITQIETGRVLEYEITLTADDVLSIDCARGTVTLNGTASRLYTVTSRSTPEALFVLEPGTTTLGFRATPGFYDALANVTVTWQSAYW